MEPVPIEFFKPERRRYRSVLYRRDGVVVEFDGGAYNQVGGPARELPHDLAHFVVEDALELRNGVWGVIAAGGLFGHCKVIAGRRPPHSDARAKKIVLAAGDQINQAEMLTRAVCDLAKASAEPDLRRMRHEWGERWWSPAVAAEQVTAACRTLREMSERWRDLAAGEAITVQWRL